MSRLRRKRRKRRYPAEAAAPESDRQPGWLVSPRFLRGARTCLATVALGGAAVWGMMSLERRLDGQEQFQNPAEYVFLGDPPAGIQTLIREHLAELCDEPWRSTDLCARVGARLQENAWVKTVKSVARGGDGLIEISCEFRRPIAVIQEGGGFIPVSEDSVRLPGRYNWHAELPIIQGSAGALPRSGEKFSEPDVLAGIEMVRCMAKEPFRGQVLAVRVSNFEGRIDPTESHIELATDLPGGRILWGSAPGREVEENIVEQKLALLRHNYETSGRLDANYRVIDVSTFPDRFIVPGA